MIIDVYFVHIFRQIDFDDQILLIIFPKAYFILCKKNVISNMLDEGEKKKKKKKRSNFNYFSLYQRRITI